MDDENMVLFGHLHWLQLRMREMEHAGLGDVWETAQEMREVFPVLLTAARKVDAADVFPIEKAASDEGSTLFLSPKKWAFAEIGKMFAQTNSVTARVEAKSLKNLAYIMDLNVQIVERDCCKRWYAAARPKLEQLTPDAPALHLAVAGTVLVSLLTNVTPVAVNGELQASFTSRLNLDYVTELDAQFINTAPNEELGGAITTVRAMFIASMTTRAAA